MKAYSNEIKPNKRHNQRKSKKKDKILGYNVKYRSRKFLNGHSFSPLKHKKQEILIKETKSSETFNYTVVDTQFHRILICSFIQ